MFIFIHSIFIFIWSKHAHTIIILNINYKTDIFSKGISKVIYQFMEIGFLNLLFTAMIQIWKLHFMISLGGNLQENFQTTFINLSNTSDPFLTSWSGSVDNLKKNYNFSRTISLNEKYHSKTWFVMINAFTMGNYALSLFLERILTRSVLFPIFSTKIYN